ncbi:MAG TPA: GntR family transcriptional regulator [Ktedonobacteraceae bacterium]|jgi:GntR family transcriptional regulator|nr:GntR family transcriptional regulator [Ktedonobacteraceae bacterium]
MDTEKQSIEFYLDQRSGVSPYLQLVQQVKQALRLGFLKEGDQLPTMRMVVSRLAINPNTVFKAYRELEHEGLIESRPGQGTFVVKTLADASLASHAVLRQNLIHWLQEAEAAGLDEESILALFTSTFQQFQKKEHIA